MTFLAPVLVTDISCGELIGLCGGLDVSGRK